MISLFILPYMGDILSKRSSCCILFLSLSLLQLQYVTYFISVYLIYSILFDLIIITVDLTNHYTCTEIKSYEEILFFHLFKSYLCVLT